MRSYHPATLKAAWTDRAADERLRRSKRRERNTEVTLSLIG